MRRYIENKLIDYIKKYTTITTNDEEEEILRYGIQIYYFNISKLLILLITSMIFDIFKETCIVFILIAILKRYAFGFHADTFYSCLLITFGNVFGIIYLSKFSINSFTKTILTIISITIFILYAPADTEEKPLVNRNKRIKLKIQTILISCLYYILSFFTDRVLSNMLILSLIFIGFNTCPIPYIFFRKEYKNYEKFI